MFTKLLRMEQRRYRNLHLIPMFIRTPCMKYLSMILLLKIFVYLPPAPVAGGLELLRTPLINQRRCQVVYILFRLTPAVQYSTVQYSTVQYSTVWEVSRIRICKPRLLPESCLTEAINWFIFYITWAGNSWIVDIGINGWSTLFLNLEIK